MAAGRAGAAARQKRLLEQLQAAKESFRSPVSAADNDGTSASPAQPPKRAEERPEPNWIPWIIGAFLAGGSHAYVYARENVRLRASPASMTAGLAPKVQD